MITYKEILYVIDKVLTLYIKRLEHDLFSVSRNGDHFKVLILNEVVHL